MCGAVCGNQAAIVLAAWYPFDVTLDVSTLSERTRAVRLDPWLWPGTAEFLTQGARICDQLDCVRGEKGSRLATPMNDKPEDADRRAELIARLVAVGSKQADPDAWIRSMTLTALRALNVDKALTPSDRGEARQEIYEIARLASNEIRAMRIRPSRDSRTPNEKEPDAA
jgi:hypothetical protein